MTLVDNCQTSEHIKLNPYEPVTIKCSMILLKKTNLQYNPFTLFIHKKNVDNKMAVMITDWNGSTKKMSPKIVLDSVTKGFVVSPKTNPVYYRFKSK